MPVVNHNYSRIKGAAENASKTYVALSHADFAKFGPSALGLGNLRREGEYVQALAAIFDLEGFTSFANQVDPHLVVPEFLVRYLEWLFDAIKREFKHGEAETNVTLWASLPFFVKFMGDGVLFLWNTNESIGPTGVRNIVVSLHGITEAYSKAFLPSVRQHVSNPPKRLRCGIARGQVVSVGEDGDYVGSCINIASRLQKMPGLSFCVSRRGIDAAEAGIKFWKSMIVKAVQLRGIGDNELVYVYAPEFKKLTLEDNAYYTEIGGA